MSKLLAVEDFSDTLPTNVDAFVGVGDRGVLAMDITSDLSVELWYFRPAGSDRFGPLTTSGHLLEPMSSGEELQGSGLPNDAVGIPGGNLAVFLGSRYLVGANGPSIYATAVRADGSSITQSTSILLRTGPGNDFIDPSEPYTLDPGMINAQIESGFNASRLTITKPGDPARVMVTVEVTEAPADGGSGPIYFAEREYSVARSGSGVVMQPVSSGWRKYPRWNDTNAPSVLDGKGRVWIPCDDGLRSYGQAVVPYPYPQDGLYTTNSAIVGYYWDPVDFVWGAPFANGTIGPAGTSLAADFEGDWQDPNAENFWSTTWRIYAMRGQVQGQPAILAPSADDFNRTRLLVANSKGRYEVCPDILPPVDGLCTVPDNLNSNPALAVSVMAGGMVVRVLLTPVAGVAPPLRSIQRDDGAGMTGHARLQTQGIARRSSSQQSGVRLGTNNTYL